MVNYSDLFNYYKKEDKAIYLSSLTLNKMKGEKVLPFAKEIIAFINHRNIKNPLELYSKRVRELEVLQRNFETRKKYDASSYTEVKIVDSEIYNLSLLLSFITTHHRFEILEKLLDFIKLKSHTSLDWLFIGVGTGYEVKLAYDYVKDLELSAFDISSEAANYAKDLLSFFGYPATSIKSELFPMELDKGIEEHENKYGKIILCEVLEHLEYPDKALSNLKKALHPKGKMFLTMAINIAQEDHIFHYSTIEQARQQVVLHGFNIVSECITPVVIFPFEEKDREEIFKKGNYICTVEKNSTDRSLT